MFIGACLCYGATSFWKPNWSFFLCGNRHWKEEEFFWGREMSRANFHGWHGKQHFSYLLQWPSYNGGHHQLNHLKKGTLGDSFIPQQTATLCLMGKNNAKGRVKGVRKARTTDDTKGVIRSFRASNIHDLGFQTIENLENRSFYRCLWLNIQKGSWLGPGRVLEYSITRLDRMLASTRWAIDQHIFWV